MSSILITNATIINEGKHSLGNVLVNNGRIEKIEFAPCDGVQTADTIIDASGKFLIPGVIDDQVHFREPGLTHKATIYTESKAAIAGGITSFMEMPNTMPQTTTLEELNKKHQIAAENSLANYSFYFGATNDNIDQITRVNPTLVCGVKVFMGSSTGNMLVDDPASLENIFKASPVLVATHCEDEQTIKNNLKKFKEQFGDDIPFKYHPQIRSTEACYLSSSLAVKMAKKHNTRLHLLHLSTAKEMELLSNDAPLKEKLITAEVCVHHLWFNDKDYEKLGWRIKWNPAVKSETDRLALIDALKNDKLDVIATDHAPHTLAEKKNGYFQCPSGGPLVQHSLAAMLELVSRNILSIEMVVDKMCHAPSELFGIEERGFIREGYFADLVLVDPNLKWKVTPKNILYKCGWSPFEDYTFGAKVTHTIVNGRLVYDNGTFNEEAKGQALTFSR
ncbi:MAG: dihydroorotase [Bacteroidales bacterium]|jgi:dihydroorotase|nr:dihydroorotase [Bacteroidales bacterium]MDD4386057.1 dihydroorotase [Bacteroidales bacterium]MDY0196640.1 dihydroorotase [Tenuifilaceae bacterium]